MLTVGQLNEKISVLRSKIAVTEGIVLYLKTHYMPSDGTTSEMHFTRSDYGKVPPKHVEVTIADYVEYLDGLRAEADALENTPLAAPEPTKITATQDPLPASETPAASPAAPPKTNGSPAQQPAVAPKPQPRKEAPSAAQRPSPPQPAPVQPAPVGKAG